jgi:hypothetical protein
VKLVVSVLFLALGMSISLVARSRHSKKCPSTSQDNWEQHNMIHLGQQFAQLCMLFSLLCDFVHVSGVGGVPQLDCDCLVHGPDNELSLPPGRVRRLERFSSRKAYGRPQKVDPAPGVLANLCQACREEFFVGRDKRLS